MDAGHVKELLKEVKYYGLDSLMFPPQMTEFEAVDEKGLKVVCKKIDGIWNYIFWGKAVSAPIAIYYCRTCHSGNPTQQLRNPYASTSSYILNFNNLASETIDPKQPASNSCPRCSDLCLTKLLIALAIGKYLLLYDNINHFQQHFFS